MTFATFAHYLIATYFQEGIIKTWALVFLFQFLFQYLTFDFLSGQKQKSWGLLAFITNKLIESSFSLYYLQLILVMFGIFTNLSSSFFQTRRSCDSFVSQSSAGVRWMKGKDCRLPLSRAEKSESYCGSFPVRFPFTGSPKRNSEVLSGRQPICLPKSEMRLPSFRSWRLGDW